MRFLHFVEHVKSFMMNHEALCAQYRKINAENPIEFESNNFVGFIGRINNVDKTYSLSKDQMVQMKDRSVGVDNFTRMFGETPIPQQVLEMLR